MVSLHFLEDRQLEVGVRGVFQDMGGESEHCVSFLSCRQLGVCILGLPPQGVSSVFGQDKLGRLLDAGVATAFVSFREPNLLCTDLVKKVPGDHRVVEGRQQVAVPQRSVVVGLQAVDDVLDSVRVDVPNVVVELHG